MIRLLGYFSALPWVMLCAVTLIGLSRGSPGTHPINLVMAAFFACCAAFFIWLTNAFEALKQQNADSPEVRRVLWGHAISAAAWLIVGIGLLSGAIYRVFSQGAPIFG